MYKCKCQANNFIAFFGLMIVRAAGQKWWLMLFYNVHCCIFRSEGGLVLSRLPFLIHNFFKCISVLLCLCECRKVGIVSPNFMAKNSPFHNPLAMMMTMIHVIFKIIFKMAKGKGGKRMAKGNGPPNSEIQRSKKRNMCFSLW